METSGSALFSNKQGDLMTRDAGRDVSACSGQESVRSQSSKRPLLGLLFATLCLLLVVGVASSFANEGEQNPPDHPTAQEIEQAINDPSIPKVEGPSTDPVAAEELPHRELDRSQALELLNSVFGPELQAPAGIFDEIDAKKFYSNHVALIAAGNQPDAEGEDPESAQPTLLESTLPLRTEGADGQEEPVDLSLEHAEGELQSANPLVEIGVPANLDEGISLPESGVEIHLADAPAERDASTVVESAAFYPNVAPESDLTVAPTPEGVETMTQLRTPQAPRDETFNLTLPKGASLKQTENGGAEVSQSGYLGRGPLGEHFAWSSWVEAPKGIARVSSRTCITVDLIEPRSPTLVTESESRECGHVTAGRPMVQSISSASLGDRERTALVFVFGATARRVFINFGPRGHKVFSLNRIDKVSARKIGIRPIEYWAHAFVGSFCLQRFASYNGAGRVLSDSGRMRCD